ncbi:MAG: hypothetical protein ACIAS6_02085 [Phycisphaerales bacterium JB060]
MRRIVDVVALGLCLVAVTLVVIQQTRSESIEDVVVQTELSLAKFHSMLKVQATTNGVAVNGRGWPNTIEGHWFDDDPPLNHLLTGDRPWVELAPAEDADRDHPADPVAFDADGHRAASFWYNPYRGVVRARVAPQINDEQTLELYNRVNGVFLATLAPEGGLRSAERERDDAQRLREMSDRVRRMAESTGAITAPGNVVKVRRVEPESEPQDPPAPESQHQSEPEPVKVEPPSDTPEQLDKPANEPAGEPAEEPSEPAPQTV